MWRRDACVWEAGGAEGHPQLHAKFEAHLGKTETNQNNNSNNTNNKREAVAKEQGETVQVFQGRAQRNGVLPEKSGASEQS